MASHFSANQYEGAFTSKALQNWEVSKQQRGEPRTQSGYTKIIGDDEGHLLENIPRTKNNPWGNYTGTWDLPKKIAGNSATNTTGRTSLAQQKLSSETWCAQEVLSGKTKNEGRLARLRNHERDQHPKEKSKVQPDLTSTKTPSGGRSGAKAPATDMMEEKQDSPVPHSNTPQKVTRFVSESPTGRRSGAGSVNQGKASHGSDQIPRPVFLSPSSRNMAPMKYDTTPEPMSPPNETPLPDNLAASPQNRSMGMLSPDRGFTPGAFSPELQGILADQQVKGMSPEIPPGMRYSTSPHGMSPVRASPGGAHKTPSPMGASPGAHRTPAGVRFSTNVMSPGGGGWGGPSPLTRRGQTPFESEVREEKPATDFWVSF